MKSNDINVILALDNIRSAQNVGALFRSADAIGIKEIWLIGITPAPIDRFGRNVGAIAKAALGAEQTMTWVSFPDYESFLSRCSQQGYSLWVVEQHEQAVDYKKVHIDHPVVIVLGNEVSGVNSLLSEYAEKIIEIPMRGNKESLNVSVAGGIVLFRLLDQ